MLPLTSIVDLYIEHGVTNHTYFINEYELNTSKFYILKGNSSVKNNFFLCERSNIFLEISFSCLEKLCNRLQNFNVEVS